MYVFALFLEQTEERKWVTPAYSGNRCYKLALIKCWGKISLYLWTHFNFVQREQHLTKNVKGSFGSLCNHINAYMSGELVSNFTQQSILAYLDWDGYISIPTMTKCVLVKNGASNKCILERTELVVFFIEKWRHQTH